MNVKRMVFAISIIYGLLLTVSPGVFAQGLPGTNMGKFVHQPGDNQYGAAAQWGRHHHEVMPPPSASSSSGGGIASGGSSSCGTGSGTYTVRRVPRHDVSCDPIVADEPIVVAGFPPLPDRLELPISSGSLGAGSGWTARAQAGEDSTASGPPRPTGVHQHYIHYEPGAFAPRRQSSSQPSVQTGSPGYYKCGEVAPPSRPDSSSSTSISTRSSGNPGYYKCREVSPDYYATSSRQDRAEEGMPRYRGSSPADLKRMGKEPGLTDDRLSQAPPAPPMPVVVNQAVTQDLSLPEDEFSYNRPARPSAAKQIGRRMGRALLRQVNRVSAYGGFRF